MREKSGGPTYESHLYERWQESKKLREDLQDVEAGIKVAVGREMKHWALLGRLAALVDDAKSIESEAKAEYDAW